MSHRVEQVSSLIQREISAILAKSIELPVGSFVTVHKVSMEPNLKHAVVSLTVLPAHKTQDVIAHLVRERTRIQAELVKHIALRFSPTLEFREDAGEAHARHIDGLLDGIGEV